MQMKKEAFTGMAQGFTRLACQTSFRLIILTASCGPILILNTPFSSELSVVSFYM